MLRDIATRFPVVQQPTMVNYDEFMKSVAFEFEKYKLINMIFATLQVSMQRTNVPTLKDLFKGMSPQ